MMWCGKLTRRFIGTRCVLMKFMKQQSPRHIGFSRMLCAATHCQSTTSKLEPYTWNLHKDHLELHYADTPMRFDFIWLRDNCRSASSFNWNTNQRILDTASVDPNIKPADVRVDDSTISLTWPDGHLTTYSLDWLKENSHEEQHKKPQLRSLWNAEVYEQANVPRVQYQRLMETDEGLRVALESFLRYGIALVDGVQHTKEDTERVAQRVSRVRETFYGRSWFITNDFAREDVGFSSDALDQHTDGANMQEPLSILLFHCLKHSGVGGRTVFVDGFYAAEQLRRGNQEHYELLSNVPVRHEYTEKEHNTHLAAEASLLSLHPCTKEPYMIRYNNFDRTPLTSVPHDVVRRWYAAHRNFTTEIRRPENRICIKLLPGTVLFVDNWRILHGRESFTGSRMLFGYFLFRDDLLNKARLLGLKV